MHHMGLEDSKGHPILRKDICHREFSAVCVAAVREICGAGTLTVWGDIAFKNLNPGPVTLVILPAGGFITLGLLLALVNRFGEWNARRHGAPAPLPVNLDCRHCTMCPNGK